MSIVKNTDNYNDVFDNIIKSKNINVTVHMSMNVNQTHYLGHQVDEPHQHPTKQLQTNCERSKAQAMTTSTESVTEPAPHTAGSLRSTHDTEDNITTGRDDPRTDDSAVPPQQRSFTTAFMMDRKSVPQCYGLRSVTFYAAYDKALKVARLIV